MTVQQKQNLLAYLGYDTGGIDGIWGTKSEAAAKAFQKSYGLEEDSTFGEKSQKKIREVIFTGETPREPAAFWERLRYFQRREFACKCGRCGGFPAEPDETLVTAAENIRSRLKVPMLVSSGVRCPEHNAAVGGVHNSRHLTGKAMDFRAVGKSAREVLALVQTYPEIRYAYAIDSEYVHMDVL